MLVTLALALVAAFAVAAPAGALTVKGVDPKVEPLPGTGFACYAQAPGDQ